MAQSANGFEVLPLGNECQGRVETQVSPEHREHGGMKNSRSQAGPGSSDWVSKAKRVSVMIGLILTFIGLIAKAYEVIPAVGRAQVMKADLDKVYERTHRELTRYSDRP